MPAPPYGTELSRARLTLKDGHEVILYRVRASEHEIAGEVWHNGFQPMTIPRDSITAVQVPEIATGRTLLVVGTIVVVLVYSLAAAIGSSFGT